MTEGIHGIGPVTAFERSTAECVVDEPISVRLDEIVAFAYGYEVAVRGQDEVSIVHERLGEEAGEDTKQLRDFNRVGNATLEVERADVQSTQQCSRDAQRRGTRSIAIVSEITGEDDDRLVADALPCGCDDG